jgi:hypothetical protein
VPNNGIYAFSTDLDPGACSTGTIYWKYVDSRYFVVEWLEVQHFANPAEETFEIILDLDTGQVILQYLVTTDVTDVVAGVENATGTEATQYAYGDPDLLAPETRVEFTLAFGTPPPQGPGTLWGTVVDEETLLPIENAEVTAVESGGGIHTEITGADGVYTFGLCADQYTVRAEADGYVPSAEVVIDLTPAATVMQDFSLLTAFHHRIYLPVVVRTYP